MCSAVLCLLAVRAKVDIAMEDTMSVYRGDPAEIHCQYSFSEEPRMMMVQWFVVSISLLTTLLFLHFEQLESNTEQSSLLYSQGQRRRPLLFIFLTIIWCLSSSLLRNTLMAPGRESPTVT